METLMIVLLLGAGGLVFGSFAGAQVWRLRAKQLVEDKEAGEPYDIHELKRLQVLTKRHGADDRSRCLSCSHQLAWYDLIPLFSWLSIGGKCRYCHKQIGYMEPLIELGVAAIFVLSYAYWPFGLTTWLEWTRFALWLAACVLMAILFVYDAKWSLLPFRINLALGIVGVIYMLVTMCIYPFGAGQWVSLAGAIAILAGLYYLFSLPGWSGLGDSILGLGLAIILLDWQKAFLAVFIANLLGTLAVLPLLARGKIQRRMHVPFGPFLIMGGVIALLWGPGIISATLDWSSALMNSLMV